MKLGKLDLNHKKLKSMKVLKFTNVLERKEKINKTSVFTILSNMKSAKFDKTLTTYLSHLTQLNVMQDNTAPQQLNPERKKRTSNLTFTKNLKLKSEQNAQIWSILMNEESKQKTFESISNSEEIRK